MPGGRQERARFRKELIEALRTYVNTVLADRCRLRLAVLFGSFARGDWRPGSDADLLVVAEGLPLSCGERWDLLSTLIKGVLVEPHAFTPEEFEELVRYGRMTAADALTEGIVLYADEEYLAKIRSLFERAREELGLIKVGNAWVRRRLLAGRGQP